MISAKQARSLMKKTKAVDYYLSKIEDIIKTNIEYGESYGVMAFESNIPYEDRFKIASVLLAYGYKVKSIPPSHYWEYGALTIRWEE